MGRKEKETRFEYKCGRSSISLSFFLSFFLSFRSSISNQVGVTGTKLVLPLWMVRKLDKAYGRNQTLDDKLWSLRKGTRVRYVPLDTFWIWHRAGYPRRAEETGWFEEGSGICGVETKRKSSRNLYGVPLSPRPHTKPQMCGVRRHRVGQRMTTRQRISGEL